MIDNITVSVWIIIIIVAALNSSLEENKKKKRKRIIHVYVSYGRIQRSRHSIKLMKMKFSSWRCHRNRSLFTQAHFFHFIYLRFFFLFSFVFLKIFLFLLLIVEFCTQTFIQRGKKKWKELWLVKHYLLTYV